MQMHAVMMSPQRNGAGDGAEAPSRRLVAAAHEFEGQMLKELLKPMTESDGLGGSDSGSKILGEFGSEALGRALSEQGGLGIAKQIIAHLSQSGNPPKAESVTRIGHFNTGMSRFK